MKNVSFFLDSETKDKGQFEAGYSTGFLLQHSRDFQSVLLS